MSPRMDFDPHKKDKWWVKESLIDIYSTPYDSPAIEARREWDHSVVTWTEWVGDWREALANGREPESIDLHAFLYDSIGPLAS